MGSVFVNNVAIIPALPLLGAFIIFIFSFMQVALSRKACAGITVFSSIAGLLMSLGIMSFCSDNPGIIVDTNNLFFSVGGTKFYWGFYIDNLSALMLFLVSAVSLFVQLYSYGYTKNEENYSWYFGLLNLLSFTMYMFVLSTNLLQSYILLEVLAVVSYLLIGFYYKKESASNAAKKAFLINKLGDIGLLLGIVVLLGYTIINHGTGGVPLLGFSDINSYGFYAYVALGAIPFTLLCLALIMSPLAKAAQIPFQIWISDASEEAPVPAAALIQTVILAAAGVFLAVRIYPLLILSPMAIKVLVLIGILTALISALTALVQSDIKRLLAYAACSQLGLIFLAIGIHSYVGGIFHLTTYVFIQALLFLCIGAVIYSTFGAQDINFLGGLRKRIPVVAYGYLVGCFALAGIFLSGFYSKEMIFSTLLAQKQYLLLALTIVAVLLSIVYIFRSYFLIFEGKYKGSAEPVKPHISMTVSIVALAIPAAFIGMMMNESFRSFAYLIRQKFYSPYAAHLDLVIFIASIAVLWIVFKIYYNLDIRIPDSVFLNRVIKVLQNKFYFDKVYNFLHKYIFVNLCKMIKFFEKCLAEGLNGMIVSVSKSLSRVVAYTQSGNISDYILQASGVIFFFVTMVVVLYFKAGG